MPRCKGLQLNFNVIAIYLTGCHGNFRYTICRSAGQPGVSLSDFRTFGCPLMAWQAHVENALMWIRYDVLYGTGLVSKAAAW